MSIGVRPTVVADMADTSQIGHELEDISTKLSPQSMKHLLFSLAFFTLVACSVEAQPALEMQDTVNWGKVVPDVKPGEPSKVTSDVVLKNTGDAMLRITNVRPGCGCTSAPLDKDSLAPGEQTIMRVALNLPQQNGPLAKTITIESNDPKAPTKVINLLADVQRPIQLSSSFIPFNKGVVGDSIRGSVAITAAGNKPVTVTCKSTQSSLVILTPMPMIIKPGETADLIVAYLAKNQGTFSVQVYVKTDLPGYESFDLSGYGFVDP